MDTFTVTIDGETTTIPMARVRELCPKEAEAFESAWYEAADAMKHGNKARQQATGREVEKKAQALLNALTKVMRQA